MPVTNATKLTIRVWRDDTAIYRGDIYGNTFLCHYLIYHEL